ncbi:MAG TPA: sulfite oxidase, partial [Elusimicrobiota bacterium]|nr:sulfite oxidase [Elusimicrobiota bacterium]
MRATILLLAISLLVPSLMAQDELLKERNARPLDAEGTLQALEPWETPISGFFIRSHHEIPLVDPSTWTLEIDGLVDKPLKLTLKDLKRYPKRSLHAVLECSGNGRGLLNPGASGVPWEKGAVGNAEWSGASLAELLRKAGIKPKAKFARVSGMDAPPLPGTPAFVRSIPVEKLLKEDTVLAWEMNRETLPLLHGGPVRLVLPDWYGQNWIKWVSHITLTEEEDPGFYMKKAYRMPSGETPQTLRVQSLITRPFPDERVPPGELEVRGKAFSGAGAIAKVELSADGGKTWVEAKVEPRHADGGWQDFAGTIAAKEGPLAVLSRATDAAGDVQPMESQPNPGGYLRNGVDSVACSVDKDADPEAEGLVQ